MTYEVLVEPAQGQRRDFARWLLARDPDTRTASHTGFFVSADVFKELPEALLVGAYVDGHLYVHVADVPAVVVPVDDGARPEAVTAPAPRRARKRQVPTGKSVAGNDDDEVSE